MSINLKGHVLNQRQLDAITPAMNELINRRLSEKKFEDACVKALEDAGCPLGYDVSMPGADSSVVDRAVKWIRDGRVGLSSRAIHDHMLGLESSRDYPHPRDPDDLNRCLLLLDLIPEWAGRMNEMGSHGGCWVGLAKRWGEISETFLNEAGLNWCKGSSAPKTYQLMQDAMGPELGVVRLGGLTIRV